MHPRKICPQNSQLMMGCLLKMDTAVHTLIIDRNTYYPGVKSGYLCLGERVY